jgi:hypothetical protein
MVSSQSLPQTPALEQNAERLRLAEAHENMKPWYLWGPYLTERQWGTVPAHHTPVDSRTRIGKIAKWCYHCCGWYWCSRAN